MKKISVLLFMFIFIVSASLFGQTYTRFTSDNSQLPWNQVYCIDFDKNNNVWFGGLKNGVGVANVSKLAPDLTTWTVYNQNDLALPEDRVFYMANDASNNMWMCTHYGLSVLRNDGTPELISWTNDSYTRTVQVDPDNNVYLSDRDSAAIFVTPDEGTTWNKWTMSDIGMSSGRPEIYDLEKDSQGRLWICTYYGVTYRDLSNNWNMITETEGLYTYAMTMDNNDHMWVPNHDTEELYEIFPDASVVTHDSNSVDVLKYEINDLEADSNGELWFATDGAGLVHFIPGTGYTKYDVASTSGQIPQDLVDIVEIKDNVLWIATADSGIVRIDGLITGISDEGPEQLPQTVSLAQNYPNPFNPVTNIRFYLPSAGSVSLVVYDILGNLVNKIADGQYSSGDHTVVWTGRDGYGNPVASGIYLYRLDGDGISISKKMVLMK
ncbi:MAG: T9SS C-terminal target domain-containing protein [Calditrichaeota bacterium]|nr:MAG: T9SS C-terminal target domain-containing protein [Calditrichota bacterium]